MTNILDPVTVVSTSGASQTLTAGVGNPVFDITETANCTYTIAAGTSQNGRRQTVTLRRRQDATGGRVATLPTGLAWAGGGYVPALTSTVGSYDEIVFETLDGGTTWKGRVEGLGVSVPSLPAAPMLTAVASGSSAAILTFVDGTPNGSPISSHNLYQGAAAGGETLVGAIATGSPYTVTGLTPNVPVYFKVSAVNGVGESPFSNEATVTPSNHYLVLNSGSGARAVTPSTSSTDVTDGYIDVAVQVNLTQLVATSGTYPQFAGKWSNSVTTTNSEWILFLQPSGALGVNFVPTSGTNGVATTSTANISTVASTNQPIWFRFTANATGSANSNTGLAARTIIFYYSFDGQNWTQLGATVSIPSTGLLTANGANVTNGLAFGATDGSSVSLPGQIFKAVIKNSAGATLANPDFTASGSIAAGGTLVDTAATPNTFTISSPAYVN